MDIAKNKLREKLDYSFLPRFFRKKTIRTARYRARSDTDATQTSTTTNQSRLEFMSMSLAI